MQVYNPFPGMICIGTSVDVICLYSGMGLVYLFSWKSMFQLECSTSNDSCGIY